MKANLMIFFFFLEIIWVKVRKKYHPQILLVHFHYYNKIPEARDL